jgi:hypothetical protein
MSLILKGEIVREAVADFPKNGDFRLRDPSIPDNRPFLFHVLHRSGSVVEIPRISLMTGKPIYQELVLPAGVGLTLVNRPGTLGMVG